MAELVHNANLEIEKSLQTSEKRLEGLRRYKKEKSVFEGFLQQIVRYLNEINPELRSHLGGLTGIIQEYQKYSPDNHVEPLKLVGELVIQDQRIQSLLREKQ